MHDITFNYIQLHIFEFEKNCIVLYLKNGFLFLMNLNDLLHNYIEIYSKILNEKCSNSYLII